MDKKLSITILIIENDHSTYLYYNEVLSSLGYHIIWAENGNKAISIFNQEKIDLVLTDIEMPIMDGLETTSIIKQKYPEIPVLVITAYAMRSVKEKAEKVNCDAFLTKPIKPKDLIKSVVKFIN